MSAKDPNENRPGYKETKVGWIPNEWDEQSLGCLMKEDKPIVYGIVQAGPDTPDGVPYIRSTDVGGRSVSTTGLLRTTKAIAKKYKRSVVQKNDLVFSLRGNIGATSKVPEELEGANLTQGTARLALKEGTSPDYVRYALGGYEVRRLVDSWAKGSTFREITIEDLRKVPLPRPSDLECKQIADILSTCDEAIEKTGDLIKAKQRQKKALMQQLLTGKKRLPGFEGEWQEAALSTLLKESRETGNLGGVAKKLTVKLYGRGVVEKRETQAGSDATQYYRRRAGQFIYSKLDFLNGAFGIVPPELDGFESTLDLPAFDVSDSVIVDWLLYYVLQENFYKRWFPLANGGRKARRINPADFKHITVRVPPLGEQQAITDLLHDCEAQLGTLEAKLSALKKQKKALMQKLLTGQVRVKV
jgi:type I restriction enzyme S subunit